VRRDGSHERISADSVFSDIFVDPNGPKPREPVSLAAGFPGGPTSGLPALPPVMKTVAPRAVGPSR
jgi:hypothetical protein